MQDFRARGHIFRVFIRSAEVFIFGLKTEEKHPLHIKVKRFRPKDVAPEAFVASCEAFEEGSKIVIFNGRLSSEKAVKDGKPVQTADGADVYTPVVVAYTVDKISASIQDRLVVDETASGAESHEKPAPAPSQSVPRAQTPQAAAPSPQPQPPEPNVKSSLPQIPF